MLCIAVILGDNTYYVSSSTTTDCPQPCHPFSYYITETSTYFTNNATFVFMKGEHLLDSEGLLQVVISDVDILTLRGPGIDGIITCSSNTRGLAFNNITIVNIINITITGCGQQDAIQSLQFVNVSTLNILDVVAYDNNYNIEVMHAKNIYIMDYFGISNHENSGFVISGYVTSHNIVIIRSAFVETFSPSGAALSVILGANTHNNVTIISSLFGNNNGNGLYMYFFVGGHNNVTISNSIFANNTVGSGGGLYINFCTDTHNNIAIINSIFTNNSAYDGGGLYMHFCNDTHNNIAIINSTITNNSANFGGGIKLSTDANAYNSITVADTIFDSNAASITGGGLYISSDSKTQSTVFITKSIATNNNVATGGGLFVHSATCALNNITITDSIFSNNNVNDTGGGMYLSGTRNNIAIIHCTIANNSAHTGGGVKIYAGKHIEIYVTVKFDPEAHNNVAITDSVFTNNNAYDGGGLYMYFCTDTHNNIAIINSTITNNSANFGGGIKSSTDMNAYNNITVANSILDSNAASITGGGLYIRSDTETQSTVFITKSIATNNNVATGGGLFVHSATRALSNIAIIDSIFSNNNVNDTGGGMYLSGTRNNISIIHCTIANNSAHTGGGVKIYAGEHIEIDVTVKLDPEAHNNVAITDSAFINNNADDGGGLYIHSLVDTYINIIVASSVFTKNYAATGGGLSLVVLGSISQSNVIIAHSTFNSNYIYSDIKPQRDSLIIVNDNSSYSGGGLYIYSSINTYMHGNMVTIINSTLSNNYGNGLTLYSTTTNFILKILCILADNMGSGIVTYGYTTVIFTDGHSIIANNSSPTDGGGVFLGKNSYLTTGNGGYVSFINNTAQRYGGAIYSSDTDFDLIYSGGIFGGYQCTIYNLSATFIDNSANKAGDSLYGGVFLMCNYDSLHYVGSDDILNCPSMPPPITSSISRHSLSTISSAPLVVCPCFNGTVNCNVRYFNREVYPGQTLCLSLVTAGLCGGVSPGTVAVKTDNNVNLVSSVTTDYTATSCTTLGYTVKLTTYVSSTTLTIDVSDGDLYHGIGDISIQVSILPCPPGLVLDSISGDCICDNDVIRLVGVVCNVSWMPYPIRRTGNDWIADLQLNNRQNCIIAHTGCPFDYCNTSSILINLNESDIQCSHNRSGILCGQCTQGLSLMIGSNRCANCTDTTLVSISIVILAAIGGIVLVVFLIVLNLTVSVGSINGILFYANIIKLNESIFFSTGNVPVVSQFISWCNLDLGIEYCFIDGLDGYMKTWLQFVFPLYLWALVIAIIIGCRYSGRLSRLCGRNAVPVLATLILTSYTKLSRTVSNALMINTVQCGDYKWNVWNIDGNIEYLSGKHIVLFTVSLFFLILGLVYTGLVFCSQWLQRYSGKCCKSTRDPVVRLKPLIDAYTGPFKDKYRFWTGLGLIVRLILTVTFSYTTSLQPKLNNYILVLIIIFMVICVGRVYKDNRLAILETLSFLNLICLSLIVILFTNESYSGMTSIGVIVSISVSMEMVLFVIIVSVHTYLAFKKIVTCHKLCHKFYTHSEELPLVVEDTDREISPARIISYREELIFDLYVTKEHL